MHIKIPFILVCSSLWIIYGLLVFGIVIWSNYMLIGIFSLVHLPVKSNIVTVGVLGCWM